MLNYKKVNNISGWIAFAIAAFTYLSTIEPTASFWDCGEFIATAYKLEVGHPPGAPLFMMLARIFMLFAGDNTELAPVMVNSLSALASAFTILFLFWTITHMARKMVVTGKDEPTTAESFSIMAAGMVGALAYTFSDSFWFSAVEGEVYAMSSFFTAIVVWLMLKWENDADNKHSLRWIIMIAFLMGLSIGVHLLNLLTIPALGFIYYYRRYKPSNKGIIITGVVSMFILGLVQNVIIPKTVSLAASFDLFFVNSLGMPFNSGVIFYALLIIGGVIGGLYFTYKKGKVLANTAILAFAFIMIGYSCYAMIVIRSKANPPMDENNPENVFSLVSYLNREQYGDWPLLYGQYYNARVIDSKQGDAIYTAGKDKYIKVGQKVTPVYDPKFCGLFPRMWSSQPQHIRAYKAWAGIKGEAKPTFVQNMSYLFGYQIGYMYGRYFMWNFAGRQNDAQGESSSNIKDGNWISGISFIDAMRLGPQSKLTPQMLNNKGRNVFYFLPLILGILGIFYQYKRDNKDAFIVFLLFIFTGVAILVFLNITPYQPRERDYAFAGSFYAFAIWIGLGVLWIINQLQRFVPAMPAVALSSALTLVAVPGLMAKEGWDDHNRSERKTSRDFAANYLNSCAPNAIIFTNGDNDTFPLWYAQEVEGIRTDVRVVNLSLLNTDWYIEQMKRKAYGSDPLPSSIPDDKLIGETRNYVPYYEKGATGAIDLKELIDFISSDDPGAKVVGQGGEELNFYPSKEFYVDVDSVEVMKTGAVSAKMAPFMLKRMQWNINKNYILKSEIAILDFIANNKWKRPIYFAVTVGDDSYMGLDKFFQLEGLAYRLVPLNIPPSQDGQTGMVNSDLMYRNVMTKFQWGGMEKGNIYMDENNLRMCMNLRNNFARLADQLINEGKLDSAKKVMDRCVEVMPEKIVPYNVFMLKIAEGYYRVALDKQDRSKVQIGNNMELNDVRECFSSANGILKKMFEEYEYELEYFYSLPLKLQTGVRRDMEQDVAILGEIVRMAKGSRQPEYAKGLELRYQKMESRFPQQLMQQQ